MASKLLPERSVLELLLGATIISASPVFVRAAHVGPATAGFYRGFFGAAALVIFMMIRGDLRRPGRALLLHATLCAVLFSSDLALWHRAIVYIGPGLATILANFQALILAAFGIVVLRERPGWRYLASIPIALLGLFLLVGVSWDSLSAQSRLGVFFALGAAVCYAGYLQIFRTRPRGGHWNATLSLTVISAVSASLMGMAAIASGEGFRLPDRTSLLAMVGYGVLCQACGWILISHALTRVPASRAGLILLLQPTLAFLWDILFFDRPTGSADVIGAALALTAIYLGSTRASASPKAPSLGN
jgi:drug/metabolite transporter (DMT)-like permease